MSAFIPDPDRVRAVEAELVARDGRVRGDEIVARCFNAAAHKNGDAHPSLNYNRGKFAFVCRVCGVKGGFVALERAFDMANGARSRRRVEATYEYRLANGGRARKLREVGKHFRWERFDGGQWRSGLAGQQPSLYRFDEIVSEAAVVIAEGERDADSLRALGFVATTNYDGAGHWRHPDGALFAGKAVAVFGDNDEPGRAQVRLVVASVLPHSGSVRVIPLPDHDVTDFIERRRREGTTDDAVRLELWELVASTPALPKADPVDAAALLDDVRSFIRRFVVMGGPEATLTALWCVHTHCIGAADLTPYISVTSATMRCGKSRLLDVLALLVARPVRTTHLTRAALARVLDADPPPTLLIDELDATFAGSKELAEQLRGILNAGYERGAMTMLMMPARGRAWDVKRLNCFGPKAFATIGKLPTTIADRSIPITLRRRRRDEPLGRFRGRGPRQDGERLYERLAAWGSQNGDGLRQATPEVPDALDDRAADVLEALFAIADRVGGDWPERARGAALALAAGDARADDSVGVRLLVDIRRAFDGKGVDRLATSAGSASAGSSTRPTRAAARRSSGRRPRSNGSSGRGSEPGGSMRHGR